MQKLVYSFENNPCPNCFIHSAPCWSCKKRIEHGEILTEVIVNTEQMEKLYHMNFEEKYWIDDRIVCKVLRGCCRICYSDVFPCRICSTEMWKSKVFIANYSDYRKINSEAPNSYELFMNNMNNMNVDQELDNDSEDSLHPYVDTPRVEIDVDVGVDPIPLRRSTYSIATVVSDEQIRR